MNKYEGLECPVCHAKFFEDDDIVICPDCGAPHHKKCWEQIGKCAYSESHGTKDQWQMPKVELPLEEEPKEQNDNKNDSDNGGFMPHIEMLSDDDKEATEKFVDELLKAGGIDKESEACGEKSADVALFVGSNATRYIHAFKDMEYHKTKINWNWMAFFIPGYWLLGRKCYKGGSLVSVFTLFVSLMTTIINGSSNNLYNLLVKAVDDPIMFVTEPVLITFLIIAAMSLTVRIIMGLLGDWFYKKHVYDSLKELHSRGLDDELSLIKHGGINFFIPIIVYFVAGILVPIIAGFII